MLLGRIGSLTWKMARPRSLVLLWMFVVIGNLAVSPELSYDPRILAAFVAVAAWYVNATCINDLSDEEVDKLNLSGADDRPLVDGSSGRNDLRWLAIGAATMALASSALVNPTAAVIVAVGLVLNLLYSLRPTRISYRGFLAQLLLPLGYVGLTFLLGAGLHGYALTAPQWLLFAGLYVSFVGRLLLKDFRDVRGDKAVGKRTFLIRHGRNLTCLAAGTAWVLGSLTIAYVYRADLLFILLLQVFTAGALVTLVQLLKEGSLPRQLILIALAGRYANGAGILLLANMSLVVAPVEHAGAALGSVAALLLLTCYPIYEELRRSDR